METSFRLLRQHTSDNFVAFQNGGYISAAEFVGDVTELAGKLPNRSYVLNLCEDRYHFLIGFVAALITGQVTLLPPNRAPRTLEQLRQQYNDSYCLCDSEEAIAGYSVTKVRRRASRSNLVLDVPGDRIAAIAFTSGSTGEPQPYIKSWSSLQHVAHATLERLKLSEVDRFSVVATVPAQHMYGLEASIMLPLVGRGIVVGPRPFFPDDIRAAISSCASKPVLVTTPLHLRACVDSGIGFSDCMLVISATAPLGAELAERAEKAFGSPVIEIYGCTEAGTIATRRTVQQPTWQPISGIRVSVDSGEASVSAPHLRQRVVLNDVVQQTSDGQLVLMGRKADLVNIAGKRMSLGDLNQKLLEINGVIDGVFVVPDESGEIPTRLTAFVVAPTRTAEFILTELRERVDPVFLPRPLYIVDHLPRNDTGKLPHKELMRLLRRLKDTETYDSAE